MLERKLGNAVGNRERALNAEYRILLLSTGYMYGVQTLSLRTWKPVHSVSGFWVRFKISLAIDFTGLIQETKSSEE